MIRNERLFSFVCTVIVALLTFCNISAQSGKPIEKSTVKPVQGTPLEDDKKTANIPKPKLLYEYVAPRKFDEFLFAIKEGGKRGFRVEQITQLPKSKDDNVDKAKNNVFAGIMKFDGEAQYDYEFIISENVDAPEQTLNNYGKNGWYLRDVLIAPGGGDNGKRSRMVKNLFIIANIYLIERTSNYNQPANDYKLLKAAFGTGRNPNVKMQSLLDAAIAEGYIPVGSYRVQDAKSLFSVDSAFCLVVQKGFVEKKYEYKFVSSYKNKDLREQIETLSRQGYSIAFLNYNSAVLARGAGQNTPISYEWLETGKKMYPANLTETLAKKSLFSFGGEDYVQTLLIFEVGAAGNAFKYQTLKMSPEIPKQFKKNPEEYLKTIEKPEVTFERFINEGYIARDIFFSEADGLTILFERQEKK